jgi:hypothetical protein
MVNAKPRRGCAQKMYLNVTSLIKNNAKISIPPEMIAEFEDFKINIKDKTPEDAKALLDRYKNLTSKVSVNIGPVFHAVVDAWQLVLDGDMDKTQGDVTAKATTFITQVKSQYNRHFMKNSHRLVQDQSVPINMINKHASEGALKDSIEETTREYPDNAMAFISCDIPPEQFDDEVDYIDYKYAMYHARHIAQGIKIEAKKLAAKDLSQSQWDKLRSECPTLTDLRNSYMSELETRGATGHQPWSKPSNHANFCHRIQSGEFDRSQRACTNRKWIEAAKKEVDTLKEFECLQQAKEDGANPQPGIIDNLSFQPKTTCGMKARPAHIPNQDACDKTKDECNNIKCLFGSKCRNGAKCPYCHDEPPTTSHKQRTKCYCCGKSDHIPEQCEKAEKRYGILRRSLFHKENFKWVRKHNPNGYKCYGCRKTHHPLFSHCCFEHYLNIPAGPTLEDVRKHQGDLFTKWCRIKEQAEINEKMSAKARTERSLSEATACRKMIQKKTIRNVSPKIIRPIYTKPVRPAGYV